MNTTFNPSTLSQVKRIIVHGNKCPDGRASAMIARSAYKLRFGYVPEISFMMYQTSEFENLPATEGLLFLDFSPPPNRADEFLAAGTIVLDHHKGPEDITKKMVLRFQEAGIGVYADEDSEPGVSGATLTYRHVWQNFLAPHPTVEDFAFVASLRDTWQRKHARWTEACEQAEALMFWQEEVLLAADYHEWADLMAFGKPLWQKRQKTLHKVSDGAYRWTSEKGTKVCTFQGTKLSSDVAEYLDHHGSDIQLIIAYDINYKPEDKIFKLGLSTRSHRGFNCRAFVGTFGGGGHTPAAGGALTLDISKDANPYKMIQDLLNNYEHGLSEAQ